MSRFRNELKVIPHGIWIATYVLWSLAVAGSIGPFVISRVWGTSISPFTLMMLIPLLFLSIYMLLVGYVYGDARRRGMRNAWTWTLLAIFIPNGIGILLYFVLREPMPVRCHSCNETHKPGLAFCPNCGARTERSCEQCHCPVEETWRNCAHCGVRLIAG
jgi:hypothetical protein